jgi:Mor family transcriptional regulator
MPRLSKAELIKLQKKLTTDDAIGKKFGVTRQAIFQIRKQYGIVSNYVKHPARNAKIVALYKKGTAGTALAKKFDLSESHTYKIINEAGALRKKRKGNR